MQFLKVVQILDNVLYNNKPLLIHYNAEKYNQETENAYRRIILEAIKLGLPNEKINDFYKFLSMDYIAVGYDLDQFIKNKHSNIGRYFTINKII